MTDVILVAKIFALAVAAVGLLLRSATDKSDWMRELGTSMVLFGVLLGFFAFTA